MGDATLPQPEFNDHFISHFTKDVEISVEESLVAFSPAQPDSLRFVKRYKLPNGKMVKTLNVEDLGQALLKSKQKKLRHMNARSVLIPASDGPDHIWQSVRLLRVDYTPRMDGVTALTWSGHSGDVKALRRLIRYGAYLDRRLLNGNTVLMETVCGFNDSRAKCVRALLAAGARVNLQNNAGHTAMTAAASVGDIEVIKLLLSKCHRTDLDHKTKKGHTALTMAATSGHIDTVRYLVEECGADILSEDMQYLTSVCWAHVTCPPVAAYLSVILTAKDRADAFIKRRLEVVEKFPDDLDLLSTFFSICLVFLQIRSVRDLLIRNGSLTTLLSHSQWLNIDYSGSPGSDSDSEDYIDELMRDFNRILPWMIALTCAMMYNDNYVAEKFIQTGSAQKYLEYVNLLAKQSGGGDLLSLFLVQASLLPIMASERGRSWLVEVTAQHFPLLLSHTADLHDHLSSSMLDFTSFFMEVISEHYAAYNLKGLKETLDSSTRKRVFPEPMYTLKNRLMDIVACFEDLKKIAHQRILTKKQQEAKHSKSEEVEEIQPKEGKQQKLTKRQRKYISDAARKDEEKSRQKIISSESIQSKASNKDASGNVQPQNVREIPLKKTATVSVKKPTTSSDSSDCDRQKPLSTTEEFQKLWVEDLTDTSMEARRADETNRLQALPEMDAFPIDRNKTVANLPNTHPRGSTQELLSSSKTDHRSQGLRQQSEAEMTVYWKQPVDESTRADVNVIQLDHRSFENTLNEKSTFMIKPQKQKKPKASRQTKRQQKQNKQIRLQERQSDRDKCYRQCTYSNENGNSLPKHENETLSFKNDPMEFPSLPGTKQPVVMDKSPSKDKQLGLTRIAQNLLKGQADSKSDVRAETHSINIIDNKWCKEASRSRLNSGCSMASDGGSCGSNTSSTESGSVKIDCSSSEDDLYSGQNPASQEVPALAPAETLHATTSPEIWDEDGSAGHTASNRVNQTVSPEIWDEVGRKDHTANNKVTPAASVQNNNLFFPSIHDNSLFSDLAGYNKKYNLPPTISHTVAAHLERQMLECNGNASVNIQSNIQNCVQDNYTGYQINIPPMTNDRADNQNVRTISDMYQGTQNDNDWAQANPISQSLNKLHETVSKASINSEGYGSSPPTPPAPEDEIQKQSNIADNINPANRTSTFFNMLAQNFSLTCKPPPGFQNTAANTEVTNPLTQALKLKTKVWYDKYMKLLSVPACSIRKAGPLNFIPNDNFNLSKGNFGKDVFLGLHDSGSEVAIKRVDRIRGRAIIDAIMKLNQGNLHSDNVLKYKGFFEDANYFYLEQDLCEVSLDVHVEQLRVQGKLVNTDSTEVIGLCWQLLNGLSVLHQAGILHMNLKPNNILIDASGNLRLADFGIPIVLQSFIPVNTNFATASGQRYYWRPREVICQEERAAYITASDMQVAGMLVHYIMMGCHPYGNDTVTCIKNIRDNSPKFCDVTDNVLANLLTWLLHPDRSLRKSAGECLMHPFFWSKERRFSFLKTVSYQPEMRSKEKSQIPDTIDAAQKWMGIDKRLIDPTMCMLMAKMDMPCRDTNVMRYILQLLTAAEERFHQLPDIVHEHIKEPASFFMTKYERVFLGVYEIIRDSEWRHRAELLSYFEDNKMQFSKTDV